MAGEPLVMPPQEQSKSRRGMSWAEGRGTLQKDRRVSLSRPLPHEKRKAFDIMILQLTCGYCSKPA